MQVVGGDGRAYERRHVAAWLAETFGGPTTYTDALGGYEHMLAKHRNLALDESGSRPTTDPNEGAVQIDRGAP